MIEQLVLVASNAQSSNKYIDRAIVAAAAHGPWNPIVATSDDLLDLVGARPSALLVIGGEGAGAPVFTTAAKRAAVSGVWFFEDPYETEANMTVATNFTFAFSNDPISATRYPNGSYLPLAAPRIGPMHSPGAYEFDFFFVGTGWPNRFDPIREICSIVPPARRKLVVTENRYIRGLKPWSSIPGIEQVPVPFEEVQRIAERSRFTVALGRSFSGNPSASQDGALPGPRLFENAAAGCVQLVSKRLYPAAFDLFAEGVEVIGYDHDLVRQIRSLLAEPDLVEKVSTAARRRVADEHLYRHRLEFVFRRFAAYASESPRPVPQAAHVRRRVLHIAHNIVSHGHYGGAELVLEALLGEGEPDDLVLVHDDRGAWGHNYIVMDAGGRVIERLTLAAPMSLHHVRHAEIEALVTRLIISHQIHHVNINHFLGFPPTIASSARQAGATVSFIAHDYFAVCDRFNLLNHRGEFCGVNSSCEGICDVCRFRTDQLRFGSMRIRREAFRVALRDVDQVIVGSRDQKARMEDLMSIPDRVVTVVPPPVPRLASPANVASPGAGPERIAVIGNFTRQKGAAFVLDVAGRLVDEGVLFEIIGRVDAEFERALEPLVRRSVVSVRGQYRPEDLPVLVSGCRFALFAPLWPETFCIALTEAQMLGLIPLAADIGALGERIQDRRDGFLFPPGDVDACLALIRWVSGRHLGELGVTRPNPVASDPHTYVTEVRSRIGLKNGGREPGSGLISYPGSADRWAERHVDRPGIRGGNASRGGAPRGRFGSFAPADLVTLPRRANGVRKRYGLGYAARAAVLYVREARRR